MKDKIETFGQWQQCKNTTMTFSMINANVDLPFMKLRKMKEKLNQNKIIQVFGGTKLQL